MSRSISSDLRCSDVAELVLQSSDDPYLFIPYLWRYKNPVLREQCNKFWESGLRRHDLLQNISKKEMICPNKYLSAVAEMYALKMEYRITWFQAVALL